MEKLSPMMQHYLKTKEEYKDCVLFYRLGDFYEMFFDDAIRVSKELELTLTGKECGLKERAPMCGVPHHAANMYISRLVEKGYSVAICEQLEDPKTAKGIVKRDVIQVITPGTITDGDMLDETKNNYLSVIFKAEGCAAAFADITTGEIFVTRSDNDADIINEISRYSPAEIIANREAENMLSDLAHHINAMVKYQKKSEFRGKNAEQKVAEQFKKNNIAELGFDCDDIRITAVWKMIEYIEGTQKGRLEFINQLNVYNIEEYMEIDSATRRNLEITETMRDKTKRGSLLWILDKTKTSMGARRLKQWIEKPLMNPKAINTRLEAVEDMVKNPLLRDEMEEILSNMHDISRIIGRIAMSRVTPKDFVSLKQSLEQLPQFRAVLEKSDAELLKNLALSFDTLDDLFEILDKGINDENVPALVRDGGVIKDGFNKDVDNLRQAMRDGKQWIANMQAEERARTGIKNLKISYNKIFGYYIEVTKSNIADVPDDYVRRQTLANCERYITPKLKELENTILGASEKVATLEVHIFEKITEYAAERIERLKAAANAASEADAIFSLAEAAFRYGYTKPLVTDSGEIEIRNGRHPVIENTLKESLFVPNDVFLDKGGYNLIILTGPNMSGKSTYMRQTALITLMAQIGSYVPAEYARIGVVDKIFTRVGASDDISSGQSTFMLEMNEVSNILRSATDRSLIILDEIGRGTSTYDGLSIAWAVAEYVHLKIGAKTLFSTHYHEMTQLEDLVPGIKNYRVAVKKRGDNITFLRKIVRGGADDSYGIEVAALAGIPASVIERAKEILQKVEDGEFDKIQIEIEMDEEPEEEAPIRGTDLVKELSELDVTTFTPIEALNKLYELCSRAKEAE